MSIDPDRCYGALVARDRRFDGLFFVGVSTTGVYCRPVCPARTPGRSRCSFFRTPAEAEKAGFRACFRCRPELAPGNAIVDAVPQLVERAVRRIDEGFLNGRGVDALAGELGVTARHLRRAVQERLGVSPVELAQSRRLALAKQLLQDTGLEIAGIAFASGFGSVRRFNAAFAERFGRSPSEVRRAVGAEGGLSLRLEYRPPFDWAGILGFLADRSIPGVERVAGGTYERVVGLGGACGIVRVRPDRDRPGLRVEVPLDLAGALPELVARLRVMFDLDARPDAVAAILGRDPALGPLVSRRPGVRLPGAVDPFEATVRAILGQQISVRAATTLAGRLVARFGTPLETGAAEGLTHRFPPAERLARAGVDAIASIGLPGRRAECLRAVARAWASGALDPEIGAEAFAGAIRGIPGIGEWTAQYLSMRALHHPDAFPASDLGVRKALGGLGPRAAALRAEAWRPWRSYAVIHLWNSLSGDES